MPAEVGQRRTVGRRVMKVLQDQGAAGAQARAQVAGQLREQRRPAEYRSRLLRHQLERGLPGLIAKTPGGGDEREKKSGRIAILWSQAQPDGMPVRTRQGPRQPLGEHESRGCLQQGDATAGGLLERAVSGVWLALQRDQRLRFERHASPTLCP